MATTATEGRARVGGHPTRRKVTDVVTRWLMGVAVAIAVLPLALLLLYVFGRGLPVLSLQVLTTSGSGGFFNAIVGSVIILAIAVVIGVPWGILVGVYLAEFSTGGLVRVVRFFSDVLSGVPTIVTGLVVYGLLVLSTRNFSAWAGGVALGVIMVPIVSRSTEEILNLVPDSLREAALAWAACLVLIAFVLLLSLTARLIGRRSKI
jgi:phosphate transport system permease protein